MCDGGKGEVIRPMEPTCKQTQTLQVVDSRLPPAVFILPVDIPGKRLLLRVTERDLEGDNLLEVLRTAECRSSAIVPQGLILINRMSNIQ